MTGEKIPIDRQDIPTPCFADPSVDCSCPWFVYNEADIQVYMKDPYLKFVFKKSGFDFTFEMLCLTLTYPAGEFFSEDLQFNVRVTKLSFNSLQQLVRDRVDFLLRDEGAKPWPSCPVLQDRLRQTGTIYPK